MKKNTASQKWRVFSFLTTDTSPVTGDAANITASLSKDYGAEVAVADTHPTEIGGGYYEFDLTQAETNADALELRPASTTTNVVVVPCPATVYTGDPNAIQTSVDTIDAVVDAIKVRTDLLGSGSAPTIRTPASSDGQRLTLTRGDAYIGSNAIRWTFAAGVARNLATVSAVRFTVREPDDAVLLDGIAATVIQSGTGTQIVDVALASTQTAALTAGQNANDVVGYFDLEADFGSGDYTTLVRRGKLFVIGDETRH